MVGEAGRQRPHPTLKRRSAPDPLRTLSGSFRLRRAGEISRGNEMLRRNAVFLPVSLALSACGYDPTLTNEPQVSIRVTSESASAPRLLSAIDKLYIDQRSSFSAGTVPAGGKGRYMYRIKGNGFDIIGVRSQDRADVAFSFYTRRSIMFGDRNQAYKMAASMCNALKQIPRVSVGVVDVRDPERAEKSGLFRACGQPGTDGLRQDNELGVR